MTTVEQYMRALFARLELKTTPQIGRFLGFHSIVPPIVFGALFVVVASFALQMNPNYIFTILTIFFSAILALMSALYLQARSSKRATEAHLVERLEGIDKQFGILTNQLSILSTQVSPLWARVQSQIASELHHPHPRYAEMDKLLEKLEAKPDELDDVERARLKTLLLERSIDMHEDITDSQRSSAKLMIGVMDKVLIEKANPSEVTEVGLVGTKEILSAEGQK